MQSLNDDNMEELFRRAGEEYPLNTSGADFDKVMQRLHGLADDLSEETKKKKDYRYLWLLLLLPLGFIGGLFFSRNKNKMVYKTEKQVNKITLPSIKTAPAVWVAGTSGITSKARDNKLFTADKPLGKIAINSKVNDMAAGKAADKASNLLRYAKGFAGTGRGLFLPRKNDLEVSKAAEEIGFIKAALNPLASKEPAKITDGINAGKSLVTVEKPAETLHGATLKQPSSIADTAAENTNKVTGIQPKEDLKPVIKEVKKSTTKPRTGKFYYSFVIGPDLSSVNFQRKSNVGYSAGLLLGFNLTKRFSFESGALWDRKNYGGSGVGLDTSKLHVPMHSIVSALNGYCDMIEIPVNIRYNVLSRQNHSWFVAVGASSYLMKNEDYSLAYTRYNMPYIKDYGYKNSSKDWFSILNVSVGYQKSIGKYTSMSIAPYAKLPLRGVGICKLPVTSTGILISLSRSFH